MPRRYLRPMLQRANQLLKHPSLHRWQLERLPPQVWYLNRHSVAAAVAAGILGGIIPGPLQMLTAAALAIWWRANLPLAMLTTLYTNPFTIMPIYWLGLQWGCWLLNRPSHHLLIPPDWTWAQPVHSLHELGQWLQAMGEPLFVGLTSLAGIAALGAYVAVQLAWRGWIRWQWHKRQPPNN